MMTLISPPAADEYGASYAGYVSKVPPGEDILALLARQQADTVARFRVVPEGRGAHRYAPGKWSVKDVLGHFTDAERIFAYRLLRIARGDKTPLPGFDENDYVAAAHFDRRPLAELLDDFRAVRQSSRALVGSIPRDCWTLVGEASGKAISAGALAYIIVGHVAHHLTVLRERYRLG